MNQVVKTGSSNVIFSDYPDVDVIRVDDTYYMVSTTMHFMPGCVILRSYNLLDWEIASYVYDELDGTPGQKLNDGKGIYGQGMWAASIRYHKGLFYVCFVANDTHKTYLYTSEKIEGPWKKSQISGFYHDMSLLFDDDDRVYIVSGNSNIRLVELESDLSGPKKGGIDKVIVQEKDDVILGYEGSHFYKINGKYYIFFIHWPKGKYRTEACYVSDKVDGPYTGCDVLNSDYKNWFSGVAQGGIVDTPDGKWFGMLFQDHGALGRMPVLVPVTFENDFPVFGVEKEMSSDKSGVKTSVPPTQDGVTTSVPLTQDGVKTSVPPTQRVERTVPLTLSILDNRPDYKYEPLYSSDFTDSDGKLNKNWQWNHIPDLSKIKLSKNSLEITSSNIAKNPCLTKNTLTQRAFTERCEAEVELDFSKLNNGDVAGLCALEGDYAFIGVEKRNGKNYLICCERESKVEPYKIGSVDTVSPKKNFEKEINQKSIKLKIEFNLTRSIQSATFYYFDEALQNYRMFGTKKLSFTLDQFVGVRFALFNYATISTGGTAKFSDFKYKVN